MTPLWSSGDSLSPSNLNARAGLPGSILGLSSNTLISESGNTINVLSTLSAAGGIISSGSARFGGSVLSTHAAVETLVANSNLTDYLYFEDSSGQRSSYLLGSHAGGTVDGLNIFDTSGNTMIVSFSKTSTRFFGPVVGPVFDTGGALASTYNAALFLPGSPTSTRIQAAINAAAADNIARVYVPASMYPYDALHVSFSTRVQMVREGGDWSGYDFKAYGAAGDGVTNDTGALLSIFSSVPTGASVIGTAGTYLTTGSIISFPTGKQIAFEGDGPNQTIIKRSDNGTVFAISHTHLTSEFGCSLANVSFKGKSTSTYPVLTLTGATLLNSRQVQIRNDGSPLPGTGLLITSVWDSVFFDYYVTDCGSSQSTACVILDTQVGGALGDMDNCQFYSLHIEPGAVDATLLSIRGNVGLTVNDNKFFGLKTHGDPGTGLPTVPVVVLSQYANTNDFFSHILGFGKGTAQMVVDGGRNSWYGGNVGFASAFPPTYAIQCTANSSLNAFIGMEFSNAGSYGGAAFRSENRSNKFLFPKGGWGANPGAVFSDVGPSTTVIWDDTSSNVGLYLYNGSGAQWYNTNAYDSRVDLTWGATITVANYLSKKYWLTATSNITAVLSNPNSPPLAGQSTRISITVKNGSGGALTTGVTGGTKYKLSGPVQPANGTQITVDLDYDQTQDLWIEASRTPTGV